MTVVSTRPRWLNARTNVYDAWELRKDINDGNGVYDYESFRVMQTQAGANMSVDVGKTGVGLMKANVRGSTRDGQGIYDIDNIDVTAPLSNAYLAQLAVAVTANASGNPRLDQIVLQVSDSEHAGSNNQVEILNLPGTPNAATTLDTRTGAAALPASCILLADVLVPNGAATIVTANIQDRRPIPQNGTVPPLLTAKDAVQFLPPPGVLLGNNACVSNASFDSFQAAVLMFLPRRIKGATRINWKYLQGGVANTGNYVLAIFDASGELKVATAPIAYTGALNTFQVRSDTIAATDFEPGYYYVFLGNAAATGTSTVLTFGVTLSVTTAPLLGPMTPNIGLHRATGGTTLPTRLSGVMTDTNTLTAATILPTVPLVTLSVG